MFSFDYNQRTQPAPATSFTSFRILKLFEISLETLAKQEFKQIFR